MKIVLAVIAAAAGMAAATPPNRNLDASWVRENYREGNFKEVIPELESALANNKSLTHDDSVFIYKHLGVMLAANEATREKGRYYMYQLLALEPAIKILDMYASDISYSNFDRVKEEYQTQATRAPIRAPGTERSTEPSREGGSDQKAADGGKGGNAGDSHSLLWIGGAVAGVAIVGTGAYFLLKDDEPKETTYYVIEER